MAAHVAAALLQHPTGRHPGHGADRAIGALAAYDEAVYESGAVDAGSAFWDFGWATAVDDAEGDVAGAVWD
ncbi:hypothetical protein V499_05531 [Pseudogymnoascus sp. VKM F-103]|nr:hypothetical protein V499_05531 [Pseudogymnoascus sp. VKM F-103]